MPVDEEENPPVGTETNPNCEYEADKAEEDNEEAEDGEQGDVDLHEHEINTEVFNELNLDALVVAEVKATWQAYMTSADSREVASEALYAALYDAAPSLQRLFKTPRAVAAMRIMGGIGNLVTNLHDPKQLKVLVETLGFQHMDLEVTVPRVAIFRDAIMDMLQTELGGRYTPKAQKGWSALLNYSGGAYVFVRLKYTDRLRILASSWATANKKEKEELEAKEAAEAASGEASGEAGMRSGGASGEASGSHSGEIGAKGAAPGEQEGEKEEAKKGENMNGTIVPTTYKDMFMFNAAVMGFAKSNWMAEVLVSFDTVVQNVANSYRLQEECDILALRMAKYKGTINLGEYKAVMLASLRSLVPKDWNPAHEVAWSWLWENVERMLKVLLGKPAVQERALERLWMSLDDNQQNHVRKEIYSKFFALAPAGQDYFKQSTTRLHFIADRVIAITLDIYKDPKKVVEDISALGLRHVGYGIPTDLFGPYVTSCVQVVRTLTEDDMAEEAFRWSLNLISRVLVRVINEGSTIVMKAINVNSGKQLKKAVGCAPRGQRANWVLNVTVGTQSISPLLWAIETGSQDAAQAIIQDLLTIRADRDRYYYGMDNLFERHPDIIKRLCADAPAILPILLDGLIWRSRLTENGQRRVNYYIRHLLLDPEQLFSRATQWLINNGDPKVICHPIVVLTTDIVWSNLAFKVFLFSKSWFLFTLSVFITAQAILKHIGDGSLEERTAIFFCRCFIYTFSMGQWIYFHVKHTYKDVRAGRIVRFLGRFPAPAYLQNWQDAASLYLTFFLLLMYILEPILSCMQGAFGTFEGAGLFTQTCPQASGNRFAYSVFSMCAMILYYLLLIDMCVFSTRISAFVLVVFRVLSEVGLFLFALGFSVLTFACAVSSLEQSNHAFAGIPMSSLSFVKVTLRMFSGEDYEELHKEPELLATIFGYVIVTVTFLVNLLTAQLNSAYQSTYEDMVGFARLNRGKIIIESMPSVTKRTWDSFINQLRLDERVEFGEGDVGLAGGIQMMEPASAHLVAFDSIRRFGGSTAVTAQWPEDTMETAQVDRFDRLERLVKKAVKRMSGRGKGKAGGRSSQEGSGGGGSSGGGSSEGSSAGSAIGDD